MKSIRFAKKKALLITSQNLVNVIKKNIINNTNIDIFTKSYKLVNSKNINDLNRFNYKCTLRSYGKLYILYLINEWLLYLNNVYVEFGHTITDHSIFDAHAREFEQSYMEDMDRLGIRRPDVLTRVTGK